MAKRHKKTSKKHTFNIHLPTQRLMKRPKLLNQFRTNMFDNSLLSNYKQKKALSERMENDPKTAWHFRQHLRDRARLNPHKKFKIDPHIESFARLYEDEVCRRRKERRQSLFATRRTGSGGRRRPRTLRPESKIKC